MEYASLYNTIAIVHYHYHEIKLAACVHDL